MVELGKRCQRMVQIITVTKGLESIVALQHRSSTLNSQQALFFSGVDSPDNVLVPPVNTIVTFFRLFIAIAIRLRVSRTDDAGHQHGETPQYFPSLEAQQVEFLADLCSATSVFYTYGNN